VCRNLVGVVKIEECNLFSEFRLAKSRFAALEGGDYCPEMENSLPSWRANETEECCEDVKVYGKGQARQSDCVGDDLLCVRELESGSSSNAVAAQFYIVCKIVGEWLDSQFL
jgi:hypothetical protein